MTDDTRSMAQICADAGLTARGKGDQARWPCPWAEGSKRNTSRPGEPPGCEGSPATALTEGRGFFCHRCGEGKGPRTLARLLGAELPADYTPPPAPVKADRPGRVDVGRSWDALHQHPDRWRSTVRAALVARGWPEALARKVDCHPDVAGAGRDAWDGCRALLRSVQPGRGLLVAMRDASGKVRDVVGRWTGDGPPPEESDGRRLKGKRLTLRTRGEAAGALVFGNLATTREAARKRRPIVIVEGEMDYLAAVALLSPKAHVIGAPGTSSIAPTIKAVMGALDMVPPEKAVGHGPPLQGAVRVWVVPDLGDMHQKHLDDLGHHLHLVGERRMLDAVTESHGSGRGRSLLDVARVRWSAPVLDRALAKRIHPRARLVEQGRGYCWRARVPGARVTRPKVDLEDLAKACEWCADTVRKTLAAGLPVIDDGDRDWREANDGELRNALHRLPLATCIDAMHHTLGAEKKDGGREPPVYVSRVRPEVRLTGMIMQWFRVHGARWFNDEARALVMWRAALYVVESPQWRGELASLGDINAAQPEGRVILQRMVDKAFENRVGARVTSGFWSAAGELRWHLHQDAADTVLRIRPDAVELIDNGTPSPTGADVVQEAQFSHCGPIEWHASVSPIDGARLLYDRLGRWWTISPDDRVLLMAYVLASLYRDSLRDRPIAWLGGEAGSGKTAAAESIVALLQGEPGRVLMDPTAVSLNVMGRLLPILAVDNAENSGTGGQRARLERLLLNAATGRQMRTRGTRTGGFMSQEMSACLLVTAIEPPTLHELTTRTLTFDHSADHRDPDFRPGVIGQVIADRGRMLSGVARIWSHALGQLDGVGRLASLVPGDHPLARLRETLAVYATLGAQLGTWDRRWCDVDAAGLLTRWLRVQGGRAETVQLSGNPITSALDRLVWRFNRVEARGGSCEMWQPALQSDELATRPVFAMAPAHQHTGSTTADETRAELVTRYGIHARRVVGVIGSHEELYSDLVLSMRAVGQNQQFVEAVPSASVLRSRWGHCHGWTRTVHQAGTRPRRYRFTPDVPQGVTHG